MIIIEPTDDQRSGRGYSSVLAVLFSELDSTNKLRDGVHIQRIRTDAAEQAPLEIPSEGQKPSRFYASEGEEWWKIFPGGACGYVQTSQGLIKKGSFPILTLPLTSQLKQIPKNTFFLPVSQFLASRKDPRSTLPSKIDHLDLLNFAPSFNAFTRIQYPPTTHAKAALLV
jgi:hypothetical protein